MRFFLLITLLSLFPGNPYAQNATDSVFHLKEIPKKGIVLNQGWTFHPGDDVAKKEYNYNGNNGIPLNPALQLDQLPEVRQSGIGWFRLKLNVDSSLRNKTLGITVSMLGAAEIYLMANGCISLVRSATIIMMNRHSNYM